MDTKRCLSLRGRQGHRIERFSIRFKMRCCVPWGAGTSPWALGSVSAGGAWGRQGAVYPVPQHIQSFLLEEVLKIKSNR